MREHKKSLNKKLLDQLHFHLRDELNDQLYWALYFNLSKAFSTPLYRQLRNNFYWKVVDEIPGHLKSELNIKQVVVSL